MREIQKSIEEIEDLLAQVVCMILRIDKDNINGRVRTVWGSNVDSKSMSAPNQKTTEDICYIQITPEDDAYNRQRHIRYVYLGGEDMASVDEHTDVYSVLFINYGLKAFDCARNIRDGLFKDKVRRFLRLNFFPLITDVPAVRRVPELVNGNWINRVDVSAKFNQYVRLIGTIGTIEKIGVTHVTDNDYYNNNNNNNGYCDGNDEYNYSCDNDKHKDDNCKDDYNKNGSGDYESGKDNDNKKDESGKGSGYENNNTGSGNGNENNSANNQNVFGARGEQGVFIIPHTGNIRNLNELRKGQNL